MARPKSPPELKRNAVTKLWESYYYAPGNPRRQIKRWGTADEAAARIEHDKLVDQIAGGALETRKRTFGVLAEEYFTWAEKSKRGSIKNMRADWHNRFAPELAHRLVVDTSDEWLRDFFKRMALGQARTDYKYKAYNKRGQEIAPNTLVNMQTLLTRILNHAIREGRLLPSQQRTIKYARRSPSDDRAWSDEDAYGRILAAVDTQDDIRLRLFVYLGLYTGQRKNLFYKLPWKLVDFRIGNIRFTALKPKKYQHDNDHKHVADTGINPALRAVLLDAYARRPNPTLDGSDLVLVNAKPLDREFKAMLAALDLPGSPHWTRHTLITSHLRQGKSYARIGKMVGDTAATLEKTYGHLKSDDVRDDFNDLPTGFGAPPVPRRRVT